MFERQPRSSRNGPWPCAAVGLVTALVALVVCGCAGAASQSGSWTKDLAAATPASARDSLAGTQVAFYRKSTAMFASLLELMAARSQSKPTYFSQGLWHSEPPCWRCDLVPGAVAAIVGVARPKDRRFRRWARETFDTAIRDHRSPDGSFGPPEGTEGNNEISTISTIIYLGTAYLELQHQLPTAERADWKRSLDGAAHYLKPDIYYYVNGNINLELTLAMYIAWRSTGDQTLLRDYNDSFQFTLHPTGSRWKGFGLKITRAPTRGDDSNGAGYLAEAGPKPPGFDPHYTGVQAAAASGLFALSHQARPRRLLNLLTNQLMTLVNRRTLVITNGFGTRRTGTEGQGRFESPVIPVAAMLGGRRGLLPLVLRQLRLAATDFRNYIRAGNDQNSVIGDYAWATLALDPPG